MKTDLAEQQLNQALTLLGGRLARNDAPAASIVICGGAALIVMGLLARTTTDVDIVALIDDSHRLVAPVPLPESLLQAAEEVSTAMGLPQNWLNNGPSRDEGGLFQMGLPDGLPERLHARQYGDRLTAYFIDRVDQIHFKLYAPVDRGGYHISDLESLDRPDEELIQAARWAVTHDVSTGFRSLLKHLLETLGHADAASRI